MAPGSVCSMLLLLGLCAGPMSVAGFNPHIRPSGDPNCPPEQVHLSLGKADGTSIVSFATCQEFSRVPTVFVGESPGQLDTKFSGTTHTYTDGGWEGKLHRVTITHSKPNTLYYYRCEGLNSTFSFLSKPELGSFPVHFRAVADLGADSTNPGAGNATISALAEKISDFPLLIHAGDIAYTKGDQYVWDDFFKEMQPAVANSYYQVCVGNHEHYYNFSGYLNRFAMPGPSGDFSSDNLFGSYDYGGVHFVFFSTEHSLHADSPQVKFLKSDLEKASQNRKKVPWIIGYAHKPLYCSTDDYYDCRVGGPLRIAKAVEHLFQKYDVDLFLAGHLHNYERSYPVYDRTHISTSYNPAPHTTHIVVGMAGSDEGLTYSFEKEKPDWSAVRHAALGFSEVHVLNATHLHFEYVLAENGTVFDSVDIVRERNNLEVEIKYEL